jgi:transcriptional regulator with XRE-family HTH domain
MERTHNIEEIIKYTMQLIKQERINKGLTIKELSKIAGLSVYKIRKIESGKYAFRLKDFNKIAEILDIQLILKRQ